MKIFLLRTNSALNFWKKTYDRRYCAQKQNIPSGKDQGFIGNARAVFAIFEGVFFWRTWCYPCRGRNKMPKNLAKEYFSNSIVINLKDKYTEKNPLLQKGDVVICAQNVYLAQNILLNVMNVKILFVILIIIQ